MPHCWKRFLICWFILMICSACSMMHEDEEIMDDGPNYVVSELNNAVKSLVALTNVQLRGNTITSVDTFDNKDGSISYLIALDNGEVVRLNNQIKSSKVDVPSLSIKEDNGELYWVLNGVWLRGSSGEKVCVLDSSSQPLFHIIDNQIVYTIGNAHGELLSIPSNTMRRYDSLTVFFDVDLQCILIKFDSGLTLESSIAKKYAHLKRDIPNQAFYKDVFLDNGVRLSVGKSLYAISKLGLSYEVISFSSSEVSPDEVNLQQSIIAGDTSDINGRLLYPDGQPRFKVLFVNGGKSTAHGKSLGEQSLKRIKAFYKMGGSYVGICGGAFLASNGYDDEIDYPYYLNIWPGVILHTGISGSGIKTDMTITPESSLLDYYDFGGDLLIKDVAHSGGGFPERVVSGGEVLARFVCPDKERVHEKPSVWAFKENAHSGRMVACGSHPESARSGERLDLTASMIQYAADGCGAVTLKGYLENGVPRVMDKKSDDEKPAFTRIGDLQCHHFAVYIPEDANDIVFTLDCPIDCNFKLMVCQDTYAFDTTADYIVSTQNGKAELTFSSLPEGIWYVGVQCMTSVSVEETEYGQSYNGRTDVLNGVPYTIESSWM